MVAGAGQGDEDQQLGRLAARGGDRTQPALQAGHPFLERGDGRVADPAVDVAELLQREERGGIQRVLEDEARGLVDGDGPGTGRRVRAAAGVDRAGPETERLAVRGTGGHHSNVPAVTTTSCHESGDRSTPIRWPAMPAAPERTLGDFDALSFDCYGTLIDWEAGITAELASLGTAPQSWPAGPTSCSPPSPPTRPWSNRRRRRSGTPMCWPRRCGRSASPSERRWPTRTLTAFGASVGRWPAFPDSGGRTRPPEDPIPADRAVQRRPGLLRRQRARGWASHGTWW